MPVVEGITTAAIALLFFMHGAKLSRDAIIAGGSHWRLHLWVMCSTFCALSCPRRPVCLVGAC
ncbi:transporter, bile acid/Na+ symporter family [Salmonella enterica subsp. arizonae]|uniref:Transporter, bile acid/Na+ symporter family n=1 Tax=Salmonella enterica subsp. arizonae TaxID=59203 RepID=A0A379T8U7_SALER|nr:transporter, bile acid/Na+ symporter family [Salmonella enterica subsp. arizonae]